jgi:hypothetical protein
MSDEERWAELIVRPDNRGLRSITLACAHGAARWEEFRSPAGGAAIRLFYASLDAQFTDEEMSPRAKATTVIRTLLAHRLEERYGCLCGYVPFAIEEDA